MAGVVKFTLDAEDQKAVSAFMRVVDAQKKTERGMKNIGKEGKNATNQTSKLGAGIKGVAGALIGGAGIAGGIALVTKGMMKWKTYTKEIAQVIKTAGQEMTAFALIQEKGTRAKRVTEVALLGAKYGIPMGQAWASEQALQSQVGSYKRGKAAFREAGKMKMTGVPMEDAEKAVSIGMGMGLTAAQAARMPYAAGALSSLTPAHMAQMAGMGLPEYGGIKGRAVTGYTIAAQLSKIYKDPSRLGTMTARVASGLSKEKVWKKLGYEGKVGEDWMGQLEYLESKGIKTTQQLTKAGFTEKRERLGLAGLLSDMPGFKKRAKDIRKLYETPGLLQRERAEAEAELPEMKVARRVETYQRELEIARSKSKFAKFAALKDQEELLRGAEFERLGIGAVSGEGGRVTTGWGIAAKIGRELKPKDITKERLEMRTGAETIRMFIDIVKSELGFPRATARGEQEDKLDIAADKLDKAADKLNTAAIKTDKAMDGISRGITAR